MKKKIRFLLTSNVDPVLFAFSCLLLISVMCTAMWFTDQLDNSWDHALETVGPPRSAK